MTYGSKDDWVSVEAEVALETDDAIAIDHGSAKLVWLPKSQLEDWPDLGKFGEVLLTRWLAEEKGLV
jgi:hypothetical protein